MPHSGTRFAAMAGACASAASLFGKVCGLPALQGRIAIRLVSFALMLLANAAVWTLYVRALQTSASSLAATVTSTATNYLLSAVFGLLVFGEVTTLLWWAGAGLILLGLILIVGGQRNDTPSQVADPKAKIS